jgi:hypothetical protein
LGDGHTDDLRGREPRHVFHAVIICGSLLQGAAEVTADGAVTVVGVAVGCCGGGVGGDGRCEGGAEEIESGEEELHGDEIGRAWILGLVVVGK